MTTCTVTVNYRSALGDHLNIANFQVSALAVYLGNPIITSDAVNFNVDDGGTFDLVQGDKLRIRVTTWRTEWYVEVPAQAAINLDELVLEHSITPASGLPVQMVPDSMQDIVVQATTARDVASTAASTATQKATDAETARAAAVAAQAAAEAVGDTNDTIMTAVGGNPDSEFAKQQFATFGRVSPVGRYDAAIGDLLHSTSNNACKYILNTYWPTAFPGTAQITDFSGTLEHQIRPPAASAFAVAGVIAAGDYDATVTGVSEADARTATVRMISSLAALHKANGGTWGGSPNTNPVSYDNQAGYWAAFLASAARLLWGDLTTAQQGQVTSLIVREADRVVDWPSWPTWRDAAGAEVYVGDSKIDDISWMTTPLVAALSIDPDGPNAKAYRATLARMTLFQRATPADLTDPNAINGLVPKDTLTGTNVMANGLVANHGIVHPDYMASDTVLFGALGLAAFAGISVPAAVDRGTDLVYQAMTQVRFTPGAAVYPGGGLALAPGGSIYPWPYRIGFYYPQGNDWGANPRRTADKADFDVQAYRNGWDRGLATSAGEWAVKHLGEQLDLQERFTTGQTYATDDFTEDNYGSPSNYDREAWVGAHMTGALLAMRFPAAVRIWDDLIVGAAPIAWATKIAATQPGLWWRLGEASGTTIADSSGNSRAGTLANFGTAPTYNTASLVPADASNGSFTLAGGSRIRITDVSWLGGGPRTIAIAFKRNGVPTTRSVIAAQAAASGTNRLFEAALQATDGTLQVIVRRTDGSGGTFQSAASVCDNAVHFLVVVVHYGGGVVYLDGKPLGQISRDGTNLGAIDGLTVGSFADSGSPSAAVVDEFMVWPRILHAYEVADLYRCFTGV